MITYRIELKTPGTTQRQQKDIDQLSTKYGKMCTVEESHLAHNVVAMLIQHH